ncbi:MAG: SigB/SigF/SigG family RNA polymerase sigma factor [Ilumatobacter sp.]|nr:MAG: SigB/SigF/SigG family RNA polymerase sigma factor [Ilumatobacter sp.]
MPADTDDIDLFRQYRDTRSRSVRNELVERHMGLAAHIARRAGRGRSDDDLRQVAMMGLVKSVDRFDPERGVAFSAFAGRTIEGELKRHFRDRTWSVRVPRSAKELHLSVRRATDELGHTLGRAPTVSELATHLDLDRDDIVAGLAAGAAQNAGTLEASGTGDEATSDRNAALSTSEEGFELAEHREVVGRLLDRLPERERRIVELRFFGEMSQSEIAAATGISQMHVSRLLRRSFEQMRRSLADSLDHTGNATPDPM